MIAPSRGMGAIIARPAPLSMPPSAMGVAFHLTVSRLASRHFWAGAGLRILAHGSTFFCGWSGIAFKVDWYS